MSKYVSHYGCVTLWLCHTSTMLCHIMNFTLYLDRILNIEYRILYNDWISKKKTIYVQNQLDFVFRHFKSHSRHIFTLKKKVELCVKMWKNDYIFFDKCKRNSSPSS